MTDRGMHIHKDKAHGHGTMIMGIILGTMALLTFALMVPINGNRGTIPNHTSIGKVDVSGLTHAEAIAKMTKVFDKSAITVRHGNTSKTFSYKDMGISFNIENAVKSAFSSRSIVSSLLNTNISMPVSIDNSTARSVVNASIVGKSAVRNESITFNNNAYVLDKGAEGKSVDADDIDQSVIHQSCQGFCTGNDDDISDKPSINVMITHGEPYAITNADDIVKSANAFIGRSYTISLDGNTMTIPKATVSQWISISSQSGKSVIVPNTNAITSSMNAYLDSLGTPARNETIITTPDGGRDIATVSYGSNGNKVVIDHADTLISNAISSNKDLSLQATRVMVPFTQQRNKAPSDFNNTNGSPWIKIDLSAQTAYAYKGTTLIKTFPLATGGAGSDATDAGTYYVNVKYTSQTMRGADYVSPNVPWVSYFNGGEGFHGAPWNTYNITHGIPSSHGCANMFIDDAKWIYDFAPIGTKVEVVGSTPTTSVR